MNYDLDTKDGMDNAIAWTTQLFNNAKHGAKWFVPRSQMLVTIYPKYKAVEIYEGFMSDTDASIERVIKAMGWNVYHIKDAHL